MNTHIFNRLRGFYKDVFECFLAQDDIIVYTNEILKEYDGRAVPSKLTLRGFIQELKNMGKLVYFRMSYINHRFERYNKIREIRFPRHSRDNKWVKTAIAVQAKYILSKDPHLTDLPPFRHNGDNTEVIDPSRYVQIRCPN